jgi:hypothetical protein
MTLTAEELLAGGALTHEIGVPDELLDGAGSELADTQVVVRPLTVRDLQRIGRAARDDDELAAGLMIQQGVVSPPLEHEQVAALQAGVARFLLERINAVSGISTPRDELEELVQAPLARACYVLAREFGWTPEEVSGMTIGQILLYLEMSQGGTEAR